MFATASELHPLGAKLPEGEIRFALKNAACVDEQVVVECVYRPARERDVRKQTHLHLIDWVFRIGSDRVSVQREEAHMVNHVVRATGTTVSFSVPLRAPDAEHQAYQLDTVMVGGRIRFGHWFKERPNFDAGFGLQTAPEALQGEVRLGGLASPPLNGRLPFWPTLRSVELTVVKAEQPTVELWDPQYKHNWDGWRQTSPHYWPVGRTIVARHIESPAVWRRHEYHPLLGGNEAPVTKASPPQDALPGVALEVFWPEGASLEFPEAKFQREAAVLPLRLARLTPRARELLTQSVARRPGVEMNSLSAAEWAELEGMTDDSVPVPVEWAFEKNAAGEEVLRAHRRALKEPWLYFFGLEYDSNRRYSIHVLLLTPERWQGELPQ